MSKQRRERKVTVLRNHVTSLVLRTYYVSCSLVYPADVSSGGRPVERPVHLGQQQRRRAQRQTAEWRRLTGLSQQKMAAKVGVGHSTYRMWETGKDAYAGPTRIQTRQLDDALRRLLREQYVEGQAFEVWGWPAQSHMSYEKIAGFLRSAGFIVPNASAAPSTMFWIQRLREPNLIHGVFSLAAAAATRAGLSARLLLDDITPPVRARRDTHAEFESRVRTWFSFADGDNTKLSVDLYSTILTSDVLAQRGWPTVESYLNTRSGVLDYLLASKVVSPLQYSTDADQSVLELVRQGGDSQKANRLLTPLRNWIVFDAEIAGLLESPQSTSSVESVVTLGAEDERHMWELWHRGSAEQLSAHVQHIYLRPAPLPSYRVPWQEPALAARTNRTWLTTYLRNRTSYDGHTDLMEWVAKAAVSLPAALNSDFRARLDPVLLESDAVQRGSSDQLSSAIADAVVAWLTA